MNEDNKANEPKKTPIWAILAIILLLLIAGSALRFDMPFGDIKGRDVANVAMWSDVEDRDDAKLTLSAKQIPDLSVEILDASSKLTVGELGTVKIKVKNLSNLTTSSWTIAMNLPTTKGYEFLSEEFEPLDKKEEKIFTISFDEVNKVGQHQLRVELQTEDKKESNNVDSVLLTISK